MVLRRLILLLILLLALTPPATAIDVRPGVPALVVIPAGFTDVAIQNAINSVNAAGGGEVRLAPGTYKKAGANWASLSLSDHVILRGPLCNRGGWWASTGKGAVLVNNDNATTIDGASGVTASLNSAILCLTFESTGGSGAHISLPTETNALLIEGNSFQGKSNAIVYKGTVYDVTVKRNFFQGQTGATVLASNSTGVGGNFLLFRENYFRASVANQALIFNGTTSVNDVWFTNNYVVGYHGAGIYLLDFTPATARNVTITANHFEDFNGANTYAIGFKGDNAYISGNTFTSGSNGILIHAASHVTIGPNTFGSITGTAINLDSRSATSAILPQSGSGAAITDSASGTYNFGTARFRHPQSMARAYNSTTQSIATATYTAVSFDSNDYDTDSYHSVSSNKTKFIVPIAGKYEAAAQLRFANSATGIRTGRFRKNGSTIIANCAVGAPISSGDDMIILCTGQFSLAANDYLEVLAYQTSGGNLNLQASGANATDNWMSVLYVGE